MFDTMLQMLRALARIHAKQCERVARLPRYLVIMKNLRQLPNLLLLTVLCVNLQAQAQPQPQAQPSLAPARPGAVSPAKAGEAHTATEERDLRARRGSDLRLALQPLKAGAASNLRPANASLKPGAEGTNVADATEPESMRDRHLSAKEREEMRHQLRQQRIRQLN